MSIDSVFENREAIIEKSRVIFAHKGLKKTTMDYIAQSVYKAKSSLYYYFKSKEEIFQAVLQKERIEIQNEIRNAVETEFGLIEKFKRFIFLRNILINKHPNFQSILLTKDIGNPIFIDETIHLYHVFEKEMIESIIHDEMKSQGVFIPEFELTIEAILIVFCSLDIYLDKYEDQDVMNIKINKVLEILLKGLGCQQ